MNDKFWHGDTGLNANDTALIKLQVTRPDGTKEVIEVLDYKQFSPYLAIPATLIISIMGGNGQTHTIGRDDFVALLTSVAKYAKIPAIKMLREVSGMGLKDAKEFVDSLVD